jgi:hypothetical protein
MLAPEVAVDTTSDVEQLVWARCEGTLEARPGSVAE